MGILENNKRLTDVLPAGQRLTVEPETNASATVDLESTSANLPKRFYRSASVTSGKTTIGPFASDRRFRVSAIDGDVEYSINSTTRVDNQEVIVKVAGVSDAAATIQAVLDEISAAGRKNTFVKVMSNGTFNLTSGITVNPYYHHLDFNGATVTYTPTTGTAITVTGTIANVFAQGLGGISNVELRNATSNTTATAIEYSGAVNQSRTTSNNHNIRIFGFGTGIRLHSFTFCVNFYNLCITNFVSRGISQTNGDDGGENISVFGGLIANGAGVGIYQETGELYLYGTSIDYNVKCAEFAGKIYMSGGHIEMNGITSGAPINSDQFVATANGASFFMDGGYFLVNNRNGDGPYGYTHLFKTNVADSYIGFQNTRLINSRNTGDLLHTGPGRFYAGFEYYNVTAAPYRMSLGNNQLIDGGGEQTTVQDFWYVADTTGTVTSRLTDNSGMAITTATDRASTGSRSIKVTRGNVGASFNQTVGLAVPCSHLRGKRLFMWLEARATWVNASAQGYSGLWTLSFAALQKLDANDRPVWYRKSAYATNFVSTVLNDTAFQAIPINNGVAQIPMWATHVVLEIASNPNTPAGASTALWLDNVHVEAY